MDEYLRLRTADPDVVARDEPSPVAAALSGAERRTAEKELASIERRLEKLSTEAKNLHRDMADHDPSDYEGLQRLTERLRAVDEEAAGLEERWLELSDLIRRLT